MLDLAQMVTTGVFSCVFSRTLGCIGLRVTIAGGSSPDDTTGNDKGTRLLNGGLPPSLAFTDSSKVLLFAWKGVDVN